MTQTPVVTTPSKGLPGLVLPLPPPMTSDGFFSSIIFTNSFHVYLSVVRFRGDNISSQEARLLEGEKFTRCPGALTQPP